MQSATIIDVAPYIDRRASATTRNEMFTLAVRISDMIYSADFRVSRKLKPDDFTIGEQVQAAVENGKMTVRRRGGKPATAKIIRQEWIVIQPR